MLSSISKILEIVVNKRTYRFVLTTLNQYGFLEKHSKINAITALTSDVINALEYEDSVLDLSESFDTLDHQILLNKLEFNGIRGTPLKWKQYVKFNNSDSSQRDITCSVPQDLYLVRSRL